MLSKIAIFLTLALFPMSTNAQLIGLENKKTDTNTIFLSRDDVKQKEIKQSAKNVKVPSADNSVSEEDETLLGEELPPPSTVTPSEIAELETSSKKKIRLNIKKQNKKDRERFVSSMTWSEKNLKIQELMKNGKSYGEAKKEVDESVKRPQIDVKKDSELEKYIYKKGNFITNAK